MGYETKIEIWVCPETVDPFASFEVLGTLKYNAWPAGELWTPIGGAIVDAYMDGVKVGETSTNEDGVFKFEFEGFPRGTHTIQFKFTGDATYDPCSSSHYDVTAVGVETRITEVDAPPSDVGVGEPFYIYGILEEYIEPVWKGLINKTVELWVDGAKVKAQRTGCSIEEERPGHDPGRWRFAVPAPQTLGVHTVDVRFPGDETHEPCSSGVIEFNAIESEVVATIENLYAPTKTEQGERWGGYFHLCNRGTGAGNVRAVISGDIEGETPIITMNPGDCQTIAFGAGGPAIFTIKTGV